MNDTSFHTNEMETKFGRIREGCLYFFLHLRAYSHQAKVGTKLIKIKEQEKIKE